MKKFTRLTFSVVLLFGTFYYTQAQSILSIASKVETDIKAQQKSENPYAEGANAPPEVTVLKYKRGFEGRFANERTPQSRNGNDEPTTQVARQSVMIISVNVRSNTIKHIIGVNWQFIVATPTEEYFRIPFITAVEIEPSKTSTIKGEIKSLPRGHPRAVTVDELEHPDKTPAQERIVISCVLFSDGSSSSLNEAVKSDCERLQALPQIRKKLRKL